MALSFRHLICAAVWVVPISHATAQAAPPGSPPAVFRTLSVDRPVSGLFYDHQDRPIALSANGSTLSGAHRIPANGLVALYRRLPSEQPGGPERRVPVTEVRLTGEGPHFLLLSSTPDPTGPGNVRISALPVNASWEIHPIETIRVLNFSKRMAAVRVGESATELPSGTEKFFPYPEGTKVWVKAAVKEPDGWVIRIGAPQAIIPGTRSLIVLGDAPPTEEDPEGRRLKIRNVIDTTRPPAPGLAQK